MKFLNVYKIVHAQPTHISIIIIIHYWAFLSYVQMYQIFEQILASNRNVVIFATVDKSEHKITFPFNGTKIYSNICTFEHILTFRISITY